MTENRQRERERERERERVTGKEQIRFVQANCPERRGLSRRERERVMEWGFMTFHPTVVI